ncbi:tripartite tricarboxylate transporter TctB family protein [Siminovitchia sp. FSL H7-0308]|uniref:tripartite tricarboxylate transporter TctB family protein n=1 Tax=Siminovitchia sp. FSL H7-0308 TaxID=2921432 RepID=UPI0030EE592C
MPESRLRDLLSSMSFLLLSIILYIASTNMKRISDVGVGPDFAPKIVAIGMFILSFILLLNVLKDVIKAKSNTTVEKNGKASSINFIKKYKNALYTIILISLYVIAMPAAGFLVSTIVYLFAQFCLLGERKNWHYPLFGTLSVTIAAAVYFLFKLGFELRLPSGILG